MKKIITIIMMLCMSNISFASLSKWGKPSSNDDFVMVEVEEEQARNLSAIQITTEQKKQHDLVQQRQSNRELAKTTDDLQQKEDNDDASGRGCFRVVTIVGGMLMEFFDNMGKGMNDFHKLLMDKND